jgi:hypothetical protein
MRIIPSKENIKPAFSKATKSTDLTSPHSQKHIHTYSGFNLAIDNSALAFTNVDQN